MEEQPIVSVSFLITEEDYAALCMTCGALSVGSGEKKAVALLGAVLLVSGVLGAVLVSATVWYSLMWSVCIACGLFCLLYFRFAEPFILRWQAQRNYTKSGKQEDAHQLTVTRGGIALRTPQLDARYPFEVIRRCIKTERFFLFYLGLNEVRALPLRLLEEEQIRLLDEQLSQALGGRYVPYPS